MNKQEFLDKLKKELESLPTQEMENAVNYYAEYLEEAGVEKEQEAIDQLGDISKLASQVKADVAMKQMEQNKDSKSVNKGMSTVWLVILAIFASPIALPLAITAIVLVFSILIVIFSLFFSLAAVAVSLGFAGICAIGGGIILFFESPANAILALGIGLVLGGIAILLMMGVVSITKFSIYGLAKLLNKVFLRRKK